MTGRSVPEWIGKTPDAAIPARVRLRVFEAHGGRCAITKQKIQPGDRWDLDHIIPLGLGGEHRESNLQPVLHEAHVEKTREDRRMIVKAQRVAAKHNGIRRRSRLFHPTLRRKMDGTVVPKGGDDGQD